MDLMEFSVFNQNLQGPIGSVIGAIIIVVLGWLIASLLSLLTKNILTHLQINERIKQASGIDYCLDYILSKIVFWFIFIIAISGALNQLHLEAISVPFANMINQILLFLPNLLAAVAVGAIGWFVATMARKAAIAALNKTNLDNKLSIQADVQPMSKNIADIIYWFILLVVLTMVVGRLGLTGLFTPLTNMIDKIFDFIPNVLMAGFVFFVGFVVARILRGITRNIVLSLNLQSFATKAGLNEKNNLPNIAGSLVFLLVLVPFTVASLDALKVDSISRPATNMLNKVLENVPNIFAAIAILLITYIVMRMLANIIKNILQNTQIDSLPSKLGLQSVFGNKSVSDIISGAILFFAMLFALIAAADLLNFEQISEIVSVFIQFSGQIILGTIILTVGFYLANLIANAVERSKQGSRFLANIVRVLIMGLVLAMGLRAMGIADSIVNLAFGLTLGAIAVAFALSFGLGGREAAARYLRRLQDKLENQDKL